MGAKRSQRRSVRYEKDQSGCMWGLISMFDFRHGRSTRKLITDKRHGSKHISGLGISKNKFEVLRNLEENCQGIIDGEESSTVTVNNASNKPSVKKLIEEEMVNEQCHPKKESEPAKRTRKKSRDMDNPNLGVAEKAQSECSCKQNNTADQQSVRDLGIDEIMEEFSRRIHQKGISSMKDDIPNGEATELLSNGRSDYEEKLRAAIKEFIVQKLTNGKHLKEDQKIQNSKELMKELEIISSDEEVFLKLVQDSQSLLVKYVQNLKDSKMEKDDESVSVGGGSESSEQKKLVDVRKPEDLSNHNKHRSFFRRKVKSQERLLMKEDDHPDNLNRIVILKPGPLVRSSKVDISLGPSQESHNTVTNKEASDRVGSHFFLSEIKRRLKNAMGKQNHETSRTEASDKPQNKRQTKRDVETGVGKGNIGRNSPTKDHFYIERIAKPSSSSRRADKINKMKDSEASNHEPNERISNIYIEAKKHLSELLSTGDGLDLSSRKNPKTLGRILSLPEYNTSPVSSPGRDPEKSFVTARTRFSPQHNGQQVDENEISPLTEEEKLESQTPITDSISDHKVQAPNSNSGSISDDIVHEIEVEETGKDETSHEDDSNRVKEEIVVSDSPREPCGSCSARDAQIGDAPVISDDKSHLACLEQEDSNEENVLESSPPRSPSGSPIANKVLDLEITTEIPERPSPVSVLEPVFSEDDISPANTTSQRIKLTIQPLRIQFEELDSQPTDEAPNGKGFTDDNDAILSYVKAVIQASGFDWDKICINLLSTEQLLNPSLVDEVELFSNRLCCDEKLLFDCINEVLVELCQYYFGSSPWVSFTKPSIQPTPNVKSITLETFKGVHWHLLQPPLPRTLEQIVRKDMEKSRTWLDARFDAETIGFDMGEAILEDLMEDTILSYADEEYEQGDSVPESKESEVAVES